MVVSFFTALVLIGLFRSRPAIRSRDRLGEVRHVARRGCSLRSDLTGGHRALRGVGGTLIKLVRVLMLGPVCLCLAIVTALRRRGRDSRLERTSPVRGLAIRQLVPWFIIGFLLLMVARSMNLIPPELLPALADSAKVLTILSMAALGLSTDARAVARSGVRIASVVILSLLALVWGGVVAARDVLPRVGYAIPTAAHPATWQCEVTPPSPTLPAGTPLALVRSLFFPA
jgi:hypothetical protein